MVTFVEQYAPKTTSTVSDPEFGEPFLPGLAFLDLGVLSDGKPRQLVLTKITKGVSQIISLSTRHDYKSTKPLVFEFAYNCIEKLERHRISPVRRYHRIY